MAKAKIQNYPVAVKKFLESGVSSSATVEERSGSFFDSATVEQRSGSFFDSATVEERSGLVLAGTPIRFSDWKRALLIAKEGRQ
ncbi:MAG TPA: hypothetical protein DCP63_03260 [Bacteroidetes bacterium]|nr:hypothetical protein [Bacteroidota bacterium]